MRKVPGQMLVPIAALAAVAFTACGTAQAKSEQNVLSSIHTSVSSTLQAQTVVPNGMSMPASGSA